MSTLEEWIAGLEESAELLVARMNDLQAAVDELCCGDPGDCQDCDDA